MNVIRCDGPDCAFTRDPNMDFHGWLHLEQAEDFSRSSPTELDFHDWRCLGAFVAARLEVMR